MRRPDRSVAASIPLTGTAGMSGLGCLARYPSVTPGLAGAQLLIAGSGILAGIGARAGRSGRAGAGSQSSWFRSCRWRCRKSATRPGSTPPHRSIPARMVDRLRSVRAGDDRGACYASCARARPPLRRPPNAKRPSAYTDGRPVTLSVGAAPQTPGWLRSARCPTRRAGWSSCRTHRSDGRRSR